MSIDGNMPPPDRRRRLLRAWLIAPIVPFLWFAVPASGFGAEGLIIAAAVLWGVVALAGLPLYALMRRFNRTGLVEYLASATLIAVLLTGLLSLASSVEYGTFTEQFVDYFTLVFPPMAVGGLLFWYLAEHRKRGRPLDPDQ